MPRNKKSNKEQNQNKEVTNELKASSEVSQDKEEVKSTEQDVATKDVTSTASEDKQEDKASDAEDSETTVDTEDNKEAADKKNEVAAKEKDAEEKEDKSADNSSDKKQDKEASESKEDSVEDKQEEAEQKIASSKTTEQDKKAAKAANKADKKEDEAETSKASESHKSAEPEVKTASQNKNTKRKEETNRLANMEDTPSTEKFSARVIVVTSGKGGVGKTTSAAAISTGLALKGHKTVVIDFDIGLRNIDLIMGCERRVVFDLINVIHGDAQLHQALIKDRHSDNLFVLAASQTRDKESLTYEGIGRVLKGLSDMGFEYIICDSPAGIEHGALVALYYADEAIIATNPEISSVRDSDRMIGIINAKSRRAALNWERIKTHLLITRYRPERVSDKEMLSIEDIVGLLTIPLIGMIPESPDVLTSSNIGESIILNKNSPAGIAYQDTVERMLGNKVELRFTEAQKKGFFARIFSK